MGIWDVDQTFLPCPNNSNWTLQQKSWRVYVEQMSRKCLNWLKTLIPGFNEMLLWPRWRNGFCTRYEVWPLIKIEVWVEYNKLCFWTKSQINLELSQTEAQTLNQQLFSVLQIFLSLEFIVIDIGVLCSRDFVKQHDWVPK